MSNIKKKRVANSSRSQTAIPSFMKGMGLLGTENLAPSDIAHVGVDRELDDKMLERLELSALSPDVALAQILNMIISANPGNSDDGTKSERLYKAMHALLGHDRAKTAGYGMGRKQGATDEATLMEIAQQFFLDFYQFTPRRRSFAELYRDVAPTTDKRSPPRNTVETDHRIRDLRRRFNLLKDRLLLRIAPAETRRTMIFEQEISTVVRSLKALNIVA